MDFAAMIYAAAAQVPGMAETATISTAGGPLLVVVGFSEPTEVVLGGEVIADAPSITYPTSAAPTLARGALLTVAGRSWRVRTVERLADGGESRATLEKA